MTLLSRANTSSSAQFANVQPFQGETVGQDQGAEVGACCSNNIRYLLSSTTQRRCPDIAVCSRHGDCIMSQRIAVGRDVESERGSAFWPERFDVGSAAGAAGQRGSCMGWFPVNEFVAEDGSQPCCGSGKIILNDTAPVQLEVLTQAMKNGAEKTQKAA